VEAFPSLIVLVVGQRCVRHQPVSDRLIWLPMEPSKMTRALVISGIDFNHHRKASGIDR